MLDFRVVIAACVAGIVILFGGIGLVASFKTAHEPAVRPANRVAERPRVEPNASLPVVIETPAVKPAPVVVAVPEPVAVAVPEPVAPPAAIETTGTIAPRSVPMGPALAIPVPAIPAAVAPAATEPVENPAATTDLPVRTKSVLRVRTKSAARKTPRRPRPVWSRPAEPQNPFSAIFGGFSQ